MPQPKENVIIFLKTCDLFAEKPYIIIKKFLKEGVPTEDSKIIELFFSRSEEAITETDRKYGKLCFEIADKILKSESDAEECVNDTFLGVWNAIPPARPNSLRSFICRIARNQALKRLDYISAKKRSRALEMSFSEMASLLPENSVADGIDNKMIGKTINDFLAVLDRDSRVIFVRKYWFLDSIADICHNCGFSESKVKSSLMRSRKKLRRFLEERGIII